MKCDELTTDDAVVIAACGWNRVLLYGTTDWLVRGLVVSMTESPLQC